MSVGVEREDAGERVGGERLPVESQLRARRRDPDAHPHGLWCLVDVADRARRSSRRRWWARTAERSAVPERALVRNSATSSTTPERPRGPGQATWPPPRAESRSRTEQNVSVAQRQAAHLSDRDRRALAIECCELFLDDRPDAPAFLLETRRDESGNLFGPDPCRLLFEVSVERLLELCGGREPICRVVRDGPFADREEVVGALAATVRGDGISPLRRLRRAAASPSPRSTNDRRARASQSMMPTAKMSARRSTSWESACSGAM